MSRSKSKTTPKFTGTRPKENYEEVFKTLYAGYTNRGKTYGYLDILNHPSMKDKKLLIIATDTVTNIEKNINLPVYKKFKDRIVILSDINGDPVQINKSTEYAEAAIKQAIIMARNDKSIKAVAIDNYDNIEEMYIFSLVQERIASGKTGKLQSYDYGVPRSKSYFYFIKPFLTMDHIHFFLTADVKEQYFDGNPTGIFDMNLPLNRRKHFSEWVWLDVQFEGTKMEKPNAIIKKWKGLRVPLHLGEVNNFCGIIEKVNEKINE